MAAQVKNRARREKSGGFNRYMGERWFQKMKRLIALWILLLLPLSALADGPDCFSNALYTLPEMDFARHCEAALADTALAGSTAAVAEDGQPVLVWSEYDAFAVMRRTDNLLMLCHFLPDGDEMMLDWHNDLLISYCQDMSLSTARAAWSGGSLPEMRMISDVSMELMLHQRDGTRLSLGCTGIATESWRVTRMTLYVSSDEETFHAALTLPRDCLAEDIFLATCTPADWRRGEEETEWVGW